MLSFPLVKPTMASRLLWDKDLRRLYFFHSLVQACLLLTLHTQTYTFTHTRMLVHIQACSYTHHMLTHHTFMPSYLTHLNTHIHIPVVHTLPLQPTWSAPSPSLAPWKPFCSPRSRVSPLLCVPCPVLAPLSLLTQHYSYLVCPLLQ